MEIYVVKEGDTVDSIAERFGFPVSSVIFDNQLVYPYPLAIGQALLLSVGEPFASAWPAYVNGYAYPYIRQNVLDETLLYLTTLSVFSYGFTTQGDLVPPAADDSAVINSALAAVCTGHFRVPSAGNIPAVIVIGYVIVTKEAGCSRTNHHIGGSSCFRTGLCVGNEAALETPFFSCDLI